MTFYCPGAKNGSFLVSVTQSFALGAGNLASMLWVLQFSLVIFLASMVTSTFLNRLFSGAEMVWLFLSILLFSARRVGQSVQGHIAHGVGTTNLNRSDPGPISPCVCSDLGARLEPLSHKFRLQSVCLWDINQSSPAVLFEEFKEP